jgi:hypothetical protein
MGRDRHYPTVLPQDQLLRRPVNEKQLQALIRKTMAKAEKTAKKPGSWADPTLSATQGPERDDDEAKKIFKEMKKREF